MFGVVLASLWLVGNWLFGATFAQAALPALTFLLRWFVVWSVLGAIYGVFSVIVATLKSSEDGCLTMIGALVFTTFLMALIWVVHYGALIWGASILVSLAVNFNWWKLLGAMVLIIVGCVMQLVELVAFAKS